MPQLSSHLLPCFLLSGLLNIILIQVTMSDTQPNLVSYDGGCHCGQVSYTAKLSSPVEEQVVNTCNCTDYDLGPGQE